VDSILPLIRQPDAGRHIEVMPKNLDTDPFPFWAGLTRFRHRVDSGDPAF
jgi:hypothetical protein